MPMCNHRRTSASNQSRSLRRLSPKPLGGGAALGRGQSPTNMAPRPPGVSPAIRSTTRREGMTLSVSARRRRECERKTIMTKMTARYDGDCYVCGEVIEVGETIDYDRAAGGA